MAWIRELVGDSNLAEHLIWYPVRKYMSKGNGAEEVEFWDDIECGRRWWIIMVSYSVIAIL